jgi:type IX secretion system substrate protein
MKKHVTSLCIVVIVTCYLLPVTCKAQTPYVAIPDSNFVHYLKTIIPTAFKGDSLNKNSTLVTTTTHTINADGLSIANLSGVQYFTSLTTLYCEDNALTTLPALPNTLTQLFCDRNHITSIPNLPNSLNTIYCQYNSLTSLPVLPTSLQFLWCEHNSLTSLPALPNSLSLLSCFTNSLTILPVLPDSLIALACDSNNISCFPTFPTSITSINIYSNPYNCLPNYVLPAMNSYTTTPLCAAGNSNGCAVAGIQQVAGINNQVTVYPNPANESLTLTLSKGEGTSTLQITDMLGNKVKQSTIYNLTSIINVTDLSEGVYNLSVSSSNGVANKRVVIVK